MPEASYYTMQAAIQCERAHEWLSRRLDGELSELESAWLARHLGRCAGCATFARDAEAFTALLRAAPLEEPEGRTAAGTIFPARRERPARRLRVGAAVVVSAVATAAAAFVVADVGVGPTAGGGPAASSGGADASLAEMLALQRSALYLPQIALANVRARVIELD